MNRDFLNAGADDRKKRSGDWPYPIIESTIRLILY